MSKSISVKVKTSTLIKALEEALEQREKRWANQAKEKARYQKEVEAYNATIIKLAKSGKGSISEVSKNNWYGRQNPKATTESFSVTLELPKTVIPKEPEAIDEMREHQYERETTDIKQGIRVLKMTDQEYVNASTYKSVAEFL